MTDKDIIKASECCVEWDCCRCPYGLSMPSDRWLCRHKLMAEVALFLKKQEDKIERINQYEAKWNALIGFINKQEGNNNGN